MTTELEKEFFEAFGIEPEKIYLCPLCKSKLSGYTWVGDKQRFECVYSWGEHPYYMGDEVKEKAIIDYEYPEITDRHYLEFICITRRYSLKLADTVIGIKNRLLRFLIDNNTLYKHQVQQLFNSNP